MKPNQVSIDTRPIVSLIVPSLPGERDLVILSSPLSLRQGASDSVLMSKVENCVSTPQDGARAITVTHTGSGSDLAGEVFPLAQTQLSLLNDPIQLLSQIKFLGDVAVCAPAAALSDPFSPTSSAAKFILQAAAPDANGEPVDSTLIPGQCTSDPDAAACAALHPTDWVFADGTKLSAPLHQPTGKTDSMFYANINAVAGTGAKFAWGLDGKLAELQRPLIGNSSITLLSATANVGNNTSNIKGQTYSDSIDWTLPISYDWKKWPGTLVFAPDFSTDIEFDRKNMLADVHLMWTALFHPLAWNAPLESGADAKYSSTNIKPGIGGKLFFQAGSESGGAIVDTIQKASSGNAKITVPAYDVARIVPQIHGLLEWKPIKGSGIGVFTFDETFTGRYLAATENTVQQHSIPAIDATAASIGLNLRPTSGWRGYNSFVTTWFPPRSANAGLGITYNDGFNPPKFSRINSVTIGLTILF